MQALHAGCSKAEPKIFAPPQIPFPGARDGQNLISWRWSLPSPTDPVWWGLMHTISSYRGNRPTNTHKQMHRQDWLQYTVPLSLAHSVIKFISWLAINAVISLTANCCEKKTLMPETPKASFKGEKYIDQQQSNHDNLCLENVYLHLSQIYV